MTQKLVYESGFASSGFVGVGLWCFQKSTQRAVQNRKCICFSKLLLVLILVGESSKFVDLSLRKYK